MNLLKGQLLIAILFIFHVVAAAALLQPQHRRVHTRLEPQGLRSQTQIEAVAKWGTLNPLSQTKLDFLGTLENPYEINKTNRASSIFLDGLIGETSPELLRRLMVESFEDVAPGRWRIVYAQDLCTSFGFGSLVRDVSEADVDMSNNGQITCEYNQGLFVHYLKGYIIYISQDSCKHLFLFLYQRSYQV